MDSDDEHNEDGDAHENGQDHEDHEDCSGMMVQRFGRWSLDAQPPKVPHWKAELEPCSERMLGTGCGFTVSYHIPQTRYKSSTSVYRVISTHSSY